MPWGVVYYRDENGAVPADDFLNECPTNIEANLLAVLEAVRAAPPPQFSGGGKWEAMHGSMGGYYEIRVTGPNRAQYRLFCILDNGTAEQLAARERWVVAQPTRLWNVVTRPLGIRSASSSPLSSKCAASCVLIAVIARASPSASSASRGRITVWKSGTAMPCRPYSAATWER
jgi:hypothetical protein